MYPQILMCDVAGLPCQWTSWQTAATLYARRKVRWEAGQEFVVLTGGRRSDGSQSQLHVNSIIAVSDRSKKFERVPPLTNRALFRRDAHLCMYCGGRFPESQLTRDHIVPQSQGGRDDWTNVCSACASCNGRKGSKTPEQAGMKLLGVPFAPDRAAYLLLMASGRRILADQQAWLESFASARTPRH